MRTSPVKSRSRPGGPSAVTGGGPWGFCAHPRTHKSGGPSPARHGRGPAPDAVRSDPGRAGCSGARRMRTSSDRSAANGFCEGRNRPGAVAEQQEDADTRRVCWTLPILPLPLSPEPGVGQCHASLHAPSGVRGSPYGRPAAGGVPRPRHRLQGSPLVGSGARGMW
jgi:hypothetical protein